MEAWLYDVDKRAEEMADKHWLETAGLEVCGKEKKDMGERDVPGCPISTVALEEWVRQGVAALASGKHAELSWNDHWSGIDPKWQMPWYSAWKELDEGVPGDEMKYANYCLGDAVGVFWATVAALPGDWRGVIEIVVPLEDPGELVTAAPDLSSVVLSWRTPPLVYLVPAWEGWKCYAADPGEEYRESYLEDPWGLRQQGAVLVFACSSNGCRRSDTEDRFGSELTIRAEAPVVGSPAALR